MPEIPRFLPFKKKNQGKTNTDEGLIDFIDEESRQKIYVWSANRVKKETKSYWYHLRIYLIDWMLIKTFFDGITIMVVISVLLTGVSTFMCKHWGVSFNFQASIAVSPLVFPLSFLIRGDFQRRERALDLLADFRSASYSLFLLCREWSTKINVSPNTLSLLLNKLLQTVVHVREYLQTRSVKKRSFIVQVVYEDMSDLSQLLEMYHNMGITGIAALMSRLHLTQQNLMSSFEKLRVIRDYRSPRSARSFAKIMMFITPSLFSPLFVYMGNLVDSSSSWAPYMFGTITAFIFGCLQSVQDRLDDPFLGVTYDEINLDDLHTWANESLKNNANRTYKTGRFTVCCSPPEQKTRNEEDGCANVKDNLKGTVVDNNNAKPPFRFANHPYLSALEDASSQHTVRLVRTQEIPGRNRIYFVKSFDEEPNKKEACDAAVEKNQEV